MIKYKNGDKDIFEKSPNTNKIQIRHVPNPNPKKEEIKDTEQNPPNPGQNQQQNTGQSQQQNTGSNTGTKQQPPIVNPPVVKQPPAPEKKPPVQEKKPPVQEEKPPVQEENNPSAQEQFNYGMRYEKGEDGTPQDNQKAADWYLKAALQGHADAQYRLGLLYSTVKGLTIKTQEPFSMNGNGQWVNKDGLSMAEATSLHWWRKAAEQGHAEAKAKLQSKESTETTQDAVKPQPVQGGTGTLQVNGETYNVYIGEIGKNKEGNTSVTLYGTVCDGKDIGNFLIQNGEVWFPVWMKIVVGGKTIISKHIIVNNSYTFSFETTQMPEKIIVYNKGDNKESVTFDGKTKKVVVTLAAMPPVK
jgi:hypothetical protein